MLGNDESWWKARNILVQNHYDISRINGDTNIVRTTYNDMDGIKLKYSQVAELVDAKITSGQRAIGEGPRKLRMQVRILSWLQTK